MTLMQHRSSYRRFGRRLQRWCRIRTLGEFMLLTSRHVQWKNARKSVFHAYKHQRIPLANAKRTVWFGAAGQGLALSTVRWSILNVLQHGAAQ